MYGLFFFFAEIMILRIKLNCLFSTKKSQTEWEGEGSVSSSKVQVTCHFLSRLPNVLLEVEHLKKYFFSFSLVFFCVLQVKNNFQVCLNYLCAEGGIFFWLKVCVVAITNIEDLYFQEYPHKQPAPTERGGSNQNTEISNIVHL